jgi:hypothetical protein
MVQPIISKILKPITNIYQESEIFSTQEMKPEALFLVGSWLRPYNFGFVRTLYQSKAKRIQLLRICL